MFPTAKTAHKNDVLPPDLCNVLSSCPNGQEFIDFLPVHPLGGASSASWHLSEIPSRWAKRRLRLHPAFSTC